METLLSRYKEQAADLGIPPEALAADQLHAMWKNVYTCAKRFHRGQSVTRESLEQTLDTLQAVVLTLQVLAEERYA